MENRIALVTGAGRGIGRAAALALSAQGARVAITSRTAEELETLIQEAAGADGRFLAITADLSNRQAPVQIVEEVTRVWGPIEILVNNAGIGSSQDPQPIVDFNDTFWDLTFAVNVTAPYLLTKLVLPSMMRAHWGRIINIGSINSKVPGLHGAAYTASKHAIAGLTKATAREVGDQGITANAVCPGVTATTMNDLRLHYDSARLGQSIDELERGASLLGRRILPAEVASLIAYLAGDEASAINGQSLNVCGGICFN